MTGSLSPVSGGGILEVIFGLAFVIVLIFALAWLYKRMGNAGLGMGGLIKVIAAMSLGNRDRIALISVGEQQLLIGISPGRIATLHVFDEAVDIENLNLKNQKAASHGSDPAKQDFAAKLQSLIAGYKA